MYHFSRNRLWAVILVALALAAMPVFADNVTVSGNVSFASLDGSALDHDGATNGTFTVDDGDLTFLGTVNCNDSGPGNNSACAMRFAVSGNVVIEAGAALYAENRTGGGSGGDVTFNVGGSFTAKASTVSAAGGLISTSRISNGNPNSSRAGYIKITADGPVVLQAGSKLTAASESSIQTQIALAGDGITIDGQVLAGHSSTIASTLYTGDVFQGGSSANASGGIITLTAAGDSNPAVTVGSTGIVATQAQMAGAGRIIIDGCSISINGLVATQAKTAPDASVTMRSATSILVDGRDLNGAGTRKGMVRADSTQGSAATYSVNLYAVEGITVHGPATGSLYAVKSNGGPDSNDGNGTINVISTESTVTAGGRAFAATSSASGDDGGTVNVSAKNDVNLDTASIVAAGDFTSTNSGRKGGHINVRSHSGAVVWTNGNGDVRPVGSTAGVPTASQGTIDITYCTTVNVSGTTFPTNGAAVGVFPTLTQTCSPAAPSLPVGTILPDCNDPAVAGNDAYTVAEGGTLNVPAPGVLGNDVDPDGDPLTAVLVTPPANASSFTLNADGSFTYVHDGSDTTTDTFTYQASDGTTSSNVASVNITITPVNDAPVAFDDAYTVDEGGTINMAAPGVLVNDLDSDSPVLTAILVSGPANASSFTLNPDGSFLYVHNGSETTSDSFTYKANDGSLDSNVATVVITITPVNDAPVAVNDAYSVNEGGTLNGASVLGNDTDAEGNALTAILVSGPANASSFTLNPDGTFTYVHDGSETTSDSFTYKANDGSADSNVATVTIAITPVNDAPVAVADAYAVNEGGTLNVAAPGVLGNDTDSDNGTLFAVLVSGPANASSFTLNVDGSFSYVHDGSETSTDSFTYRADDGTAQSAPVTVTITINPVNDAPVANDDSGYTVAEGGTLNGSSVLANDTDAENDALTAVLVSGPANASSFTLNADGTFTYVHDGGETTSDSFTYKANDGSLDSNVATVTITITPVNDAPVAVGDAYSVNEGGTLNGSSVLTNDTDADGDTLTAILVTGPANASSFTLNADGTFTYVHDGSETTSDSFTYKANDGTADSNTVTVTITITPVNDAPVANPDAYSVAEGGTLNGGSVLTNDTDAENDTLTAILVSGPANASSFTLNPDGTFTYVHNGGETASDSFTYKANDGTADSNTTTVTITITPVNDAPVANPDTYSVGFHGTLNVAAPGVLGNDTDVDGPGMTAILVSTTTQGSLTFNADGSFSYTHTGPTLTTDSFTYKVNDGSADSNTTTVTINIVNQAPTAADDSFIGVGNTELRVGTGGALHPAAVVSGSVLSNDTDADNGPSPLTATFSPTSANGGTVTGNPNGSFNYLPPTGFTGVDSFTYTISDGLATDSGTVTIAVNERVWYVNPAAAGPQTGRSTDPFATIGQAQGASAVNDYIHVAQGAQASGILLKDGQRLIGSGVALVVGPYTLAGATVRPTLGSTVILADGNVVAGLNVGGIGAGITGTAVTSGTITEVGVTSAGGGTILTNTSGTFTLTNVTLTPGGAGLTISGGTATVNAANLDVTTTGGMGIFVDAGTLNISAGADGSTVSSTNNIAVNISNATLGVVLRSVNGSGAANGIKLLNTTGSFSVTGAGTAGTGGTIQNTTTRGADLQHAGSVSLAFMNFTNASAVNGDSAAICGNTLAGTNLGCNAAIHAVGATSLSLNTINVTGGAQIGINGNNVANLSMSNVSVTGAGNENLEHGVQFVNLSGTSSVTNSTFSNNFHRQFTVQNSTGTLSLTATGSTFSSNGAATGAQGVLISGHGTANITTNVQSSTFTNNFSTGYFSDGADSAVLDVTVANNTFTNNGGGGVTLAVVNASTLSYDVTGNAISGGISSPISVLKGTPSTGAVSGTISGNTLGLAGVPASACSAGTCDGILLNGNGTGAFTAAIDNNIIRNFNGRGIAVNASGAVQANVAIRNNSVSQPGGSASAGIFAQSGVLLTDTSSLCADIHSNTISGTYSGGHIRVRNRFAGTTFRLPGYAGAGNDTTAVAAFLSGQNGGAIVTATINANTFGGGATCVAP
ncbi:MAG TPA: Ig-like domain-containing protein [Thermoanaerobaculia bacterium]|nr:Ig-like domain-containing protein [Thermoanaerobaculia bacterium]